MFIIDGEEIMMVLRRRFIVVGVLIKDISGNIFWCCFGYGFVYEMFRMMMVIFVGKSILENKS